MAKSDSEKVEAALAAAAEPLSVEELARTALKSAGARQVNLVRVVLHRLDARGVLIKYPQTYALKKR